MIKISISEEHYSFLNDIKSCFENSPELEIRANYSRKSSVDLPMQIIIHLQDISVQDVVDWSVKGAVSGVAAAVGKDVYSLLKSGIKKVCQKFKDSSLTIIYEGCWYQLGKNKKIKLTHPFDKSAEFGERTIDEFFTDFGLEANPESADWRECKLSDIAEIIAGYAFKSDHFGDVGFRVVKIKDIKPPIVDIENSDRVDLACYSIEKLTKYKIEKGDFVVAMTGATIGKVGKVVSKDEAFINQRVAKIAPLKNVDKNFIYYSLVDDGFGQFIQNNIDSHSAQENISGTSIGRYPILLPSLPEQKAIAEVLTSLDDKIDLLHKQNKTLEQLAETLFEEWIEGKDFDGSVSQLISIQNGYAFKSSDFKELGNFGVLKIKNISSGIININQTDFVEDPLSLEMSKKFSVKSGDILIGMTGAEIGKLGVVPKTDKFLYLNQRVGLLREKYEGAKYLAYIHLKSEFGQDYIDNAATGSAQPNISGVGIEECTFPVLTESQIKEYSNQIAPFYEKIVFNLGQIQSLEKLRDQLLPKLMSGEVKV